MTVFVPPETLVRTDTWEHNPLAVVEQRDGSFVISVSGLREPKPFKHVSRAGRTIFEFTDSATAAISRHQAYHLASARDGTFWSAPYYGKLQLRHWSAPGVPAELLLVETPHYPPYSEHQAATATAPESPMLMGMWLEPSGSIMLAVRIPDDTWNEAYGPVRGDEGPYPYRAPTDLKRAYDTMLLRVNPQNGVVMAERRLDDYVTQMTESGELIATSQTADGFFQLTVLSVSAPLMDSALSSRPPVFPSSTPLCSPGSCPARAHRGHHPHPR
jgi:hypothetical protein